MDFRQMIFRLVIELIFWQKFDFEIFFAKKLCYFICTYQGPFKSSQLENVT
jgi:hypothetical protein